MDTYSERPGKQRQLVMQFILSVALKRCHRSMQEDLHKRHQKMCRHELSAHSSRWNCPDAGHSKPGELAPRHTATSKYRKSDSMYDVSCTACAQPARSTRLRHEVLMLVTPSSVHLLSSRQEKTQWDRLELVLALVAALCLFCAPLDSRHKAPCAA